MSNNNVTPLTAVKTAAIGIGIILAFVGIAVMVIAMVAPQFIDLFAAHAAPIVTGESSLVESIVVGQEDSSAGVTFD